jgi:hypothetical protein
MRRPKARRVRSRRTGGRLRARSRRWVWARTQPVRRPRRATNPVTASETVAASRRQPARTRASSKAREAPWAMLGDMPWAASPTSSTTPRLNWPVKALQRPDGAAQPQRHAVAQDLVQLGPGQGQARADVPPQLVQVDVDEQAPPAGGLDVAVPAVGRIGALAERGGGGVLVLEIQRLGKAFERLARLGLGQGGLEHTASGGSVAITQGRQALFDQGRAHQPMMTRRRPTRATPGARGGRR